MEEKNVTRISLSTFFLILAIIAIIIMGIFIYKLNNDKTAEIQKSTELQSQVNSLNGTVSDLQGKIDNISNTINSNNSKQSETNNNTTNPQTSAQPVKEKVKYDVEVPLSEIENIKSGIDNTEIKAFYQKYKGKIIKVTGYVSAFGDEYDCNLGVDLATGVNIGNSQSYKTRVYAYGVTYNSDIIKKIHNLKEGAKISLIGTLPDSWSQPVEIHLTNIVAE